MPEFKTLDNLTVVESSKDHLKYEKSVLNQNVEIHH